MALSEALPAAVAKPLPLEGVSPAQSPAWIETALFGTPDELRKVDPNSATAAGTTVLMLAADNVDKVRGLLQRGAKANTRKVGLRRSHDGVFVPKQSGDPANLGCCRTVTEG
jgi:hypothetical protein